MSDMTVANIILELQTVDDANVNQFGRVDDLGCVAVYCCDECGNVSRNLHGWRYLPPVNWTLCNRQHVTRDLSPCTFDAAGNLIGVRS